MISRRSQFYLILKTLLRYCSKSGTIVVLTQRTKVSEQSKHTRDFMTL